MVRADPAGRAAYIDIDYQIAVVGGMTARSPRIYEASYICKVDHIYLRLHQRGGVHLRMPQAYTARVHAYLTLKAVLRHVDLTLTLTLH